MSEQTQNQSEVQAPEQTPDEENWLCHLKKVLLAGLGVVALAQEEIEQFVNKLVEKGALAEQDGRKWIKDFLDKRYKQTKDTVHNIEDRFDNLDTLLQKLNVPTKSEYEELAAKIDDLGKRVDALSQNLQNEPAQNAEGH